MRAAVYDAHLPTLGGGERYAAMLAAVLVDQPGITSVDLVGHGDLAVTDLEQHLGLSLAGVTLRLVPDRGDAWVSALSAEYDVFVNASYMSRAASQARVSAYAVYFPTPWDHDLTPLQRRLSRVLGPRVARRTPHDFGLGWFPPEGGLRRSWSWTCGDAELVLPPGEAATLDLVLGRPGAPEAVTASCVLDEVVLAEGSVQPDRFRTLRAAVPASNRPRVVHVRSATFSPPAPDQRSLGVALAGLSVDGSRAHPLQWLAGKQPYLLRDSANLSFLDSYQQVVSISDYTAHWVQRYWGRSSEVLYPPVHTSAVPAGAKQPMVLSIGRFFAAERGHSKKQLELVRAFVAAQERGLLEGWEYHLVGGCSDEDRPYLEQVRRAGAGHAVHLHPNAPRELVRELLGSASLFWHATGLGEDLEDRPWAFEHFGITTVEAMAAGCVPVVIAHAGQGEIVRDGTDGYLFTTLDELVQRSAALAADPTTRAALAAAAVARADTFSEHAFAERWGALVHELLGPR
jgi:glycosyltransferase involved in cell wall biosynthesis